MDMLTEENFKMKGESNVSLESNNTDEIIIEEEGLKKLDIKLNLENQIECTNVDQIETENKSSSNSLSPE